MSHISKLKLSTNMPAAGGKLSPKERVRTKALQYLEHQLRLIQGQLSEQPYLTYRMIYRSMPDGQRVRVQEPMHIRRGWIESSGLIYFRILYGSKPVLLDKTSTAIEVGTLEALPDAIATLLAAVKAGELDAALIAAVAERKKNFNKRKSIKVG